MMNTPTMDESARILAAHIRAAEQFSFWRFGDGAFECLAKRRAKTCDGERYSIGMANAIRSVRDEICKQCRPNTYLGDWFTASFGGAPVFGRAWLEFLGSWEPKMLSWEAVLLMRDTPALRDFYRAVLEDPRRKLYMGAPWACITAQERLGLDTLVLPTRDLWSLASAVTAELYYREFDVLYFGGGLAGMICAARSWASHPDRSYVHLGSALDPCTKRTRSQQLSQETALAILPGALGATK